MLPFHDISKEKKRGITLKVFKFSSNQDKFVNVRTQTWYKTYMTSIKHADVWALPQNMKGRIKKRSTFTISIYSQMHDRFQNIIRRLEIKLRWRYTMVCVMCTLIRHKSWKGKEEEPSLFPSVSSNKTYFENFKLKNVIKLTWRLLKVLYHARKNLVWRRSIEY